MSEKENKSEKELMTITGRIGIDSKITETKNEKKVAAFTVAENKPGEEKATWHNVLIWDDKEPNLDKFKKGDLITITGEVKASKYTDKEGKEKTKTDFIVYKIDDHKAKGEKSLEKIEGRVGAEPKVLDSKAVSFSIAIGKDAQGNTKWQNCLVLEKDVEKSKVLTLGKGDTVELHGSLGKPTEYQGATTQTFFVAETNLLKKNLNQTQEQSQGPGIGM